MITKTDTRAAQEPTSTPSKKSSGATTARSKTTRITKASSPPKPRIALGPMSEAARLEMFDWLVFLVGGTADRPSGYHRIAQAMSLHFNDDNSEGFPSLATLAAGCGMSKATAVAMADLLEADGHIEVVERGTPGRGHSTKYKKLMKPLPDDVLAARKRVGLGARRKRATGRSKSPETKVSGTAAGSLKGTVADLLETKAADQKGIVADLLTAEAVTLKGSVADLNPSEGRSKEKESKQERGAAAARTTAVDRDSATSTTTYAAVPSPAFTTAYAAATPPPTQALNQHAAADAARVQSSIKPKPPCRASGLEMGTVSEAKAAGAVAATPRGYSEPRFQLLRVLFPNFEGEAEARAAYCDALREADDIANTIRSLEASARRYGDLVASGQVRRGRTLEEFIRLRLWRSHPAVNRASAVKATTTMTVAP